MTYEIIHETTFTYPSLVNFSHNIARLTPISNQTQTLLEFSLESTPQSCESSTFKDIYGNINTHMLIRKPHTAFLVSGKSLVKLHKEAIEHKIYHVASNSITYAHALQRLASFDKNDLFAKQFLFPSLLIPQASDKIKRYALESFSPQRDLFEAAHEFTSRIFEDFAFVSGFSSVTTPIEEIYEAKKGVCQDFAQFAISALRAIGLPARYESGYIETLPPHGSEKLFGADASHAWFSLYIPTADWISFDPTNNCIPRHQHIHLGSGRDYLDIAPLKGVVFGSGHSKLSVVVDVRRVD